MKPYEVIKKVRALTKKSQLLRKIIDFVPALRRFDRLGFVYARVKDEEQKIIRYLSEDPRPTINLVCDLRCTPPTYGDFSAFLMAVRIISTKFKLTFFIVVDELNSDWDLLTVDNQKKRLADFKELAKRVTSVSDSRVEVVDSFEKLSALTVASETIFSDYMSKRKKIYWDLRHLNDLLFDQLGCSRDNLLDNVQFSEIKTQALQPFILWHIRRNSKWDKSGDTTNIEILEHYKKLRKVLGNEIKIVVCASDEALADIFKLASKLDLDIINARNYSENFLGDLTLMYTALFFVQIGGGGMSEYIWSSSVPFLDVDLPLGRDNAAAKLLFGINFKKHVATNWQNSNQIVSLRARNKKNDLETNLIALYHNLQG